MTKAEEILEKHLAGYDTAAYTDKDRKLKQLFLNAINEAFDKGFKSGWREGYQEGNSDMQ